ncbi:recQ-mediated genome instability protein 1 isoform X2 [Cyclopterus lumpus]|uniref:recQ-mediated genome instability protein 1 isoform X2 n=1 Tax=Cyclopterus lumpus TaxID=8103 RepID=UPI0014869DEB|nr:recQ-mediated genome instability protein 1 isoform X2 [Cyclopterus lumpus]
MAPEIQAVVHATQAWLKSSWHVQVPFAWLEACVEWLQEEAGGAGSLSQQQINQQALDQWLLTDLRHLSYPVLPDGLSQAQKTELSGTFCVQVDSLLDVSQPAYSQMQKWRGSDCTNDEVSAVTQFTQRAWEARPTRMLLMQVTDGVQSLEAMEYQSVPALSTALRPGVKLQLQGQMVCRLGMLLLGPSNIKVLGGEVEDLVERNNPGKVLCRTLGLPEEKQEGGEPPPAPVHGNQEVEDLELDDAELLASLEAQEEVERVQVGPVPDSGYGTLSETATLSSRSSSMRSLFSTASSRSGSAQSNRGGSVQGHHHGTEQEEPEISIQQRGSELTMAVEDFPDEDFDDLPLNELDSVVFPQSNNVTTQSVSSHRSTPQSSDRITGNPNRATKAQTAQCEQHSLNRGSGSRLSSSNSRSTPPKRDNQGCLIEAVGQVLAPAAASHELGFVTNDNNDVMDDDMDCFLAEVETDWTEGSNQLPVQQGPSRDRESFTNKTERFSFEGSHNTPQGQLCNPNVAEFEPIDIDRQSDGSVPALTLTSPPFTYVCLLEEMTSKPQPHTTEIRVKAFIVTLVGKLSSNNGLWRVGATISDGTGYLDVELSDAVLTGLLGFSVAGKAALKRDPARRGELDTGMRRCQEGLVDMCCVMTIVFEPGGSKALVTKADPVNEKVFQELEQRLKDRSV